MEPQNELEEESAVSGDSTALDGDVNSIITDDSSGDDVSQSEFPECPLPTEKRFKAFFPLHGESTVKAMERCTRKHLPIYFHEFDVFKSMSEFIDVILRILVTVNCMSFYIGITTSPAFRWCGSRAKGIVGHKKSYDGMYVLNVLDPNLASHYEQFLIDHFKRHKPRMIANIKKGGERAPTWAPMKAVFIYMIYKI